MGAPKQKWTSEEEAALKAGIIKYGPGKWLTILKDPEFSGVLYQRSNIDLKDKWRNLTVMANGWGSREKKRMALKSMILAPQQDESPVAVTPIAVSDNEIAEVRPATSSSGYWQNGGSRRSIRRLDNLIMEAINNLKEPGGSNKTTIATYMEDEHWAPPNFKRLLSARLKYLTASGKLIKMKRKYRMDPKLTFSNTRRNLSISLMDNDQMICCKVDPDDINVLSRSQIDLQLTTMSMSPQEAAGGEQAVAEADTTIAEAEEPAEADAEAAQAFADAAVKTLQGLVTTMSTSPQEEAAAAQAEADTAIAEAEEAPEADAEAVQAFSDAAVKRLEGRSIPRMLVDMVKKFVGM